MRPILDGRTYLRVGSIRTGKMVIYPIADNVDGQGHQLINWVAEIEGSSEVMNDWNRGGRVDDFISIFKDWTFDWLDVPSLIRNADQILEYPMVDKDPVAQWTFGRVTLMGDAAHPMYPRGSNGSAQALIDARTLASELAQAADPVAALHAYEAQRREATARVVLTNRSQPPDVINIRVEELSGDRPYRHIDDLISQEASSVIQLYRSVSALKDPDHRDVLEEIRGYTENLVEVAWPAYKRGEELDDGESIITLIHQKITAMEPKTSDQAVAYETVVASFFNMTRARSLRIDSADISIPKPFWFVIFGGSMMSIPILYFLKVPSLRLHVIFFDVLSNLHPAVS
jgi:hypothetical protein